MRAISAILVAAATMLAACSNESGSRDAAKAPSADVIYTNAVVWTGAADMPRAEAVAIADGFIIGVGDAGSVDALKGDKTKVVDLGGAFVAPGFIDNHTHFLSGGLGLASVQLRDAASKEEFSRRIGDFAASSPEGRWIRFGDWDHQLWGGELPRADWIDAVTPDNPVFVFRLDGHMALANSLAMRLAGVTAETPDPAGGEIVRDADGTPTGVFKDNAMNLIAAVMPPLADEEIDAAFLAAQDVALAHGVTEIHDMGDGDGKSLPDFRRQKEAGRMRIRVYALSPLADWPTLAAYVEENGRGDDRFRWDGLKGFVDGSLGSATAWFYDPFTDRPDYSGMPVADLDELKADIEGADAAGLHVAVHAIGDRANDWLLDAYESAVSANGEEIRSRRFRIEHAQHLTTGEIDRFAHLGVIASMQPYHAIDDGRWAETKIGPERIKTTYAFRSLIDAGAVLTFGSDWSVAPLDPLAGIYAAVTRRTIDGANPGGWVPAQKITVDEALHAYTAANAYAGFQEDNLGTIEPGKLADLVVLADDVTQIDPTLIADVKVLRTIVGGKEEYRAEE